MAEVMPAGARPDTWVAAAAPGGAPEALEEERQLVPEPALETSAHRRARLAALRTGDVGLEQPLLEERCCRRAPRDHRDLRVAVERPRVEVDGAEADGVVRDDDFGVDDRAGDLPHLHARC